MSVCKFCEREGRHYIGGEMWVCFTHFLKLFS